MTCRLLKYTLILLGLLTTGQHIQIRFYILFFCDSLFAATPLFLTKSLIICTVLCANTDPSAILQWVHSILVASFPLDMWSLKYRTTALTSALDHTFFGAFLASFSGPASFPVCGKTHNTDTNTLVYCFNGARRQHANANVWKATMTADIERRVLMVGCMWGVVLSVWWAGGNVRAVPLVSVLWFPSKFQITTIFSHPSFPGKN